MRSRYSLRKTRRAYSLLEVVVASTAALVLMAASTVLFSGAGRAHLAAELRGQAGQRAALAMLSLSQDLREAGDVLLPQTYQVRIYFPALSGGVYDRFHTDYTAYIEYVRADGAGTANAEGAFLWKKDQTGAGRIVCRDLDSFTAAKLTTRDVRISLGVRKVSGTQQAMATLNQRVTLMRNPPL